MSNLQSVINDLVINRDYNLGDVISHVEKVSPFTPLQEIIVKFNNVYALSA